MTPPPLTSPADLQFGTLVDASVREAWAHEAHVFTPWLAANLGRLSEVIGIPLELEGVEVAVGRFSADILAINPQDGGKVLIENQLEHGDHTHLGQMLTYLTGLQAQTVIWVAPNFRDEHRSAIKWLNDHTVEPFTFFAVRVRVVRIGDSPLAPLFEVVEQPNGWDRRLQEVVRQSSESSPLTAFRRAFWTWMAERYPNSGFLPQAVSSQWFATGGDMFISAWIGQGKVGLFVRGQRGEQHHSFMPQLSPYLDILEEQLGVSMGSPPSLFNKTLVCDLTDQAQWPTAGAWLAEQVRHYTHTLDQILETDPHG